MKANMVIGVKGEYDLIRRKAITDDFGNRVPGPVMEESGFVRNILTTRFFDDALTVNGLTIRACVVGSGTGTPDESDTTLDSYVANTITRQSFSAVFNATVSPRYVARIDTFRFGEGVAAGNITEVGMVPSSFGGALNGSAPLMSRALVKNGSGVPITMTILSDEFLDVIFKQTWYVPEDVTGSVTIAVRGTPTAFDYTIRAMCMANGLAATSWDDARIDVCPITSDFSDPYIPAAAATSTLQPYTFDPSTIPGYDNRITGVTGATYVPGSKNRTFKFVFGPTAANIAAQSFFHKNRTGCLGAYQILLSEPLPTKLNTEQLAFYVNMALANVP